MAKQAGAILLLVLVVLLLLAGLSTVGLKAQQQLVRAEQFAVTSSERERRGIQLLKTQQADWQQWLLLWPPGAADLDVLCTRYWFFAAGGVCEQQGVEEERLWWLWQHDAAHKSRLTLVVQPYLNLQSEHLWAWDVHLQQLEGEWQPQGQRWYRFRHPVNGAWRHEEGELWWSGVLP